MSGRTLAAVLVMGVSGCGKSTVGEALAARLGWPFADGDDFHPPANVAKMRSGTPLTDADRIPWLHIIAGWIDQRRHGGTPGVVTCSALKRAYREILMASPNPSTSGDVRLVYLHGSASLIAARQAARQGHFMPASLVASQFATLEQPGPEEHPLTLGVELAPEQIVERIVAGLGLAT